MQPRSNLFSSDLSKCSVNATFMPMARGSVPSRFPVVRSWYCSHLDLISFIPSLSINFLSIHMTYFYTVQNIRYNFDMPVKIKIPLIFGYLM